MTDIYIDHQTHNNDGNDNNDNNDNNDGDDENDDEVDKEVLKRNVTDALTCCVCIEIVEDTYYSCDSNGNHKTCISCKPDLKSNACPVCGIELMLRKDSTILYLAAYLNVERRCKYHANGCDERIPGIHYEKHVDKCEYRHINVDATVNMEPVEDVNTAQNLNLAIDFGDVPARENIITNVGTENRFTGMRVRIIGRKREKLRRGLTSIKHGAQAIAGVSVLATAYGLDKVYGKFRSFRKKT